MSNTCIALFSINICFFSVLAERSLLLFFITRIEGLSNLYSVAVILHAYSLRTGLVPEPSGWKRRSSAVCIKGGEISRVVRKREPVCLKCSEGLVTVNNKSLSIGESSPIRMARRSPSV